MESNTISLVKKKFVFDFIKDYCQTPRSFMQIMCAVSQHSHISEQQYDAAVYRTMKSIRPDNEEILKILLGFIGDRILVHMPFDLSCYRFYTAAGQEQSLAGIDRPSVSNTDTLSFAEFRELLKFLSHLYNVASCKPQYQAGSFDGRMKDSLMAAGQRGKKQSFSLVSRLSIDSALSQLPPDSDLSFLTDKPDTTKERARATSITLTLSNRQFVPEVLSSKLQSLEQDLFLFGTPLLICGSGDSARYIPIFFFSLSSCTLGKNGTLSFSSVVGPFLNQEFLDSVVDILVSSGACDYKRNAQDLVRGFEARVNQLLAQSDEPLTAAQMGLLSEMVAEYFPKLCHGTSFAYSGFQDMLPVSLTLNLSDCIVFGGIFSFLTDGQFSSATARDFRKLLQASEEEMRNSALGFFFASDQPPAAAAAPATGAVGHAGAAAPTSARSAAFNSFNPDDESAVVFPLAEGQQCDRDQLSAVRSMLRNEVTLLQGPPGTGKTMAVATAAFNHMIRGQKVLVTSYNNAAVESFMSRAVVNLGSSDSGSAAGSRAAQAASAPEHHVCFARLLKDDTNNSALSLSALARNIISREHKMSLEQSTAFTTFAAEVQQTEASIERVNQLKHMYESDFNRLQAEVDSLAGRFLTKYSDGTSVPYFVRKLFALLFPDRFISKRCQFQQLRSAAAAAGGTAAAVPGGAGSVAAVSGGVGDEESLEQDLKLDLGSFNRAFNVCWYQKAQKQQEFLQKIDDLVAFVESGSIILDNAYHNSRSIWHKLSFALLRGRSILRCLDRSLLLELLRRSRELSVLKYRMWGLLQKLGCGSIDKKGLEFDISTLDHKPEEYRNAIKVTNKVYALIRSLSDPKLLAYSDQVTALRSTLQNMKDADEKLKEQIDTILNFFPITTTSLLSVASSLPMKSGIIDLVIFDEAAQFSFIDAIPVLFRAKRIAVIGDPKQLEKVGSISRDVIKKLALSLNTSDRILQKVGINDSLFDFVKFSSARSAQIDELILRSNRRSEQSIVNYISRSFYSNQLIPARNFKNEDLMARHRFIPESLYQPGLNFIEVEQDLLEAAPGSSSRFSRPEAERTMNLVKDILTRDYQGSIGIIAPFRAHTDYMLSRVLQDPVTAEAYEQGQLDISSVHKFQGKECDTIIYNLCLDSQYFSRFALNEHLINVAMSRARDYLFVLGNKDALITYRNYACINTLLEDCHITGEAPGPRSSSLALAQTISSHALRQARFDTDMEEQLYQALKWEMDRDEFFRENEAQIFTQLPVGRYRLDLAMVYQNRGLDIECDGSQHYLYWLSEQNNQLIPYDVTRTDELAKNHAISFTTIRFHNCTIRQDVKACARKVLAEYKKIVSGK